MTQLPPLSPEQAAYERGFRDGARFLPDWRVFQTGGNPLPVAFQTPEVATQAARHILGGRLDMRDARSFLAGVTVTALVTIAALLTVGPVKAHDITQAAVDCTKQTITITGTNFDIPANSPVTVSGPGYTQTFPVTTPDWTQVLGPIAPSSLIPNGVYTVTWPGAGTHAITFQVFCQRSEPTPTPVVTPAPTPTPTPTFSPTPNPTSTPVPTPVVTPEPTPAPTETPTETPTPRVTLPPTDTDE